MRGRGGWFLATHCLPELSNPDVAGHDFGHSLGESRTLFLIQVAAISLEANAWSALSNTLMLPAHRDRLRTGGYSLNPGRSRNSGTKRILDT